MFYHIIKLFYTFLQLQYFYLHFYLSKVTILNLKIFVYFHYYFVQFCFIYWIPAIDKLLNWIFEASSGSVAQSLAWHFRSQTLLDLSTTIINNFEM